MKKIIAIIISLSLLLLPALSLAQGLKDAGGKLSDTQVGLSSDLPGTASNVVNIVFYIVGTLFLILVIYGSFVWLKAAGREEEINRAKKIIYTSVVGLIVVMASYAITNFILSRTGG